jgi:VWFA-related protein
MKTPDHSSSIIGHPIIILIGLFLLGLLLFSNAQEKIEEDFKIKISVEEVRIDAMVMDRKGRQITDLTSEDFEIYQDGNAQKITSCTYINDYIPQPGPGARKPQDSKSMPPVATPLPTREEVRRTFVFVVDNLIMDFTQVYRARRALQKFIETQMQPGDLAAIMPTLGGNAALQMFSSNRQHLLAMINDLRWFIEPRTTRYMPTMMAVSYYLRALQDMPGRKSLILISPVIMIGGDIEKAFNLISDAALRAGVVIHTLNIKGLETPSAIDSEFDLGAQVRLECDGDKVRFGRSDPECFQERAVQIATRRMQFPSGNAHEKPLPLSKKTGGLFISDFNWFVNGLGDDMNEALKGYYLLTYIPPTDTFTYRKDPRDAYRRIKVKVKRPKSEVHTRDGFFGIAQPSDNSAENSGSLVKAIFSPFRFNDLKIDLSSGYIDDPQKGYVLQSRLYLDGKDLTFIEKNEDTDSISIEAAILTSDVHNAVQDSSIQQYDFLIKKENVPWMKENGFIFSIALPVKNPGAYYVRTAVKDMRSGKIGSAYQFMEIPDLKNGRLSLSNIFLMDRDEDAPWAQPDTPQESRKLLSPDMRRDHRNSPANKSYLPGETITYAAVIYNAVSGALQKPALESQFILYGNGKVLREGPLESVDISGARDFKRIPIRNKLVLENAIEPGDYVLMLSVKDIQANKKFMIASQSLDFKVLPK